MILNNELNPSAATFPSPKSPCSPSISTTSTHSASTWTSFSTPASHPSPPTSASQVTPTSTSEKKINTFGQGWLTSTPFPPLSSDSNKAASDKPQRTRSPSLPVLPSQEHTLPKDLLAQLDLNDDEGFKGPRFKPHFHSRPYPTTATAAKHRPSTPPLVHHESFPHLYTPRRRISNQVCFLADLDEEDDVHVTIPRRVSPASRLASAKSLPSLTGPAKGKNVYIASVSAQTTENQLEEFASRFGQVLSSRIQPVGESAVLSEDGTTYKSTPARRCAFVLFEHPDQAATFLSHLKSLGMACDFAKEDFQTEWKSREDRESSNLYIQGLPLDTTIEELYNLLTPFGTVVSSKFLESGHVRRGPALARLECRPQADRAIKALNGKPFGGPDGPILQVRIADSEEQKDFKRKASTLFSLDHSGGIRDDFCRASVPNTPYTLAEAARLEGERRYLVEALRDIEERQARLGISSPCASAHSCYTACRADNSPCPSFSRGNTANVDVVSPRPEYHRRQSSSALSIAAPSLVESARSYSMASVASMASSAAWSPVNPSGLFRSRLGEQRVHSDRSLHHARSSPELGMNLDKNLCMPFADPFMI